MQETQPSESAPTDAEPTAPESSEPAPSENPPSEPVPSEDVSGDAAPNGSDPGSTVFDGTILHKVLRIHQVRYGVDLFWYDVIWIGSGILGVLLGLLILWRTRPARTRA